MGHLVALAQQDHQDLEDSLEQPVVRVQVEKGVQVDKLELLV